MKPRLALHWKILIGLALGLVVGAVINLTWTPAVWQSMGVEDPAKFLDPQFKPRLPAGVESIRELPPEQAARIDPNHEAGTTARIARFAAHLTGFVGDLFIRALRFIAVPIVLFSLIVGAASLNDLRKLSRIGGKTIAIYLCTTAVAITIGLGLANVIRPGKFVPPETRDALRAQQQSLAERQIGTAEAAPTVWQTLLDLLPRNPFEALAKGEMLQVVILALIIGIALTLIRREKAEPVVRFCDGMTEVIIKIVNVVMLTAPYAVFALIAPIVATMGLDVLRALLVYTLVVIAGLALHMLVVYPLLFKLFTNMGYVRFFRGIAPAQLLAFSSSSSSATLPVTMQCARDRLGVSDDVTSFVLPLGATINMDGTALYQGVAAVFIAQMYNMGLTVGDQLTIVLTATLASIGTAGVPGVGIIMLVIVLRSVNVPLEGIAVILGVDRLLDMCRTTVNVTGDAAVATVVASTERELLTEEQVEQRRRDREGRGLDENP